MCERKMNKQKKQKLLNIWNKVKKPLMILSIIGNLIFLMFIIIGCVGSHKKATQTKAEDYNLSSLVGTTWKLNERPEEIEFSYNVDFESNDRICHLFRMTLYHDEFRLLYGQGLSVWSSNTSWSSTSYQTIHITGGDDIESTTLIEYLYDSAILMSIDYSSLADFPNFTFNNQINYNAPYNASIDSPFILHTFEGGQEVFSYVIELPKFVSNGEIFDSIRLWYFSGYATSYLDSGGLVKTNDNQGTAYYNYMEYINTETNTQVMVNYRNFVNGNVNGSVQTYLTNGSEWKNDNYRKLVFLDDLSSSQATLLSQFNNQLMGYTGFGNGETNIGLGNSFSLIAQCFEGVKNIFAIEVLPNISLGVFVFLPLIVGIIITIIWIVKR